MCTTDTPPTALNSSADMFGHYDLVTGLYSITGFVAETGGVKFTKPLPDREWTADSLAGTGVR